MPKEYKDMSQEEKDKRKQIVQKHNQKAYDGWNFRLLHPRHKILQEYIDHMHAVDPGNDKYRSKLNYLTRLIEEDMNRSGWDMTDWEHPYYKEDQD